ncbi:MAG: alcohol dehydrogenase catalytic domain-containing protein [Acutalibacteraceae bacterium]|nr:alcohol dehydrogenase catalytic domain-containing protein [Acutalibacteraceae bacterium]
MINYIYQLINPQFFSIKLSDVNTEGKVLVRPKYMAICHADQRYYRGQRDMKVLTQKLPMALIHECCGEVLTDDTGTFKSGQQVVMIPNAPTRKLNHIYENYDEKSKFLSSSSDGFMREFIDLTPDRVVPCDGIPPYIACIAEFYSVALHAVERMLNFAHSHRDEIAILGDGPLAYVVACAIRERMPQSHITVIGRRVRKLARFSFVDKTYVAFDLPDNYSCDHAFECAGGEGSYDAINDIIKHIRPQGTILLMGVSENQIPIDTRMILEKGLTVVGSSRSGKKNFEDAIALMQTQRIRRRLGSIIYEDAPVNNIDDIHRVFATDQDTPFKTVFQWNL